MEHKGGWRGGRPACTRPSPTPPVLGFPSSRPSPPNPLPLIPRLPSPNHKQKGVTVVVGNPVDKIVKDPTRDVLLEVYAPW